MNSPTESGTMPPMPVPCCKCRRPIGETDAYCKHCGARQQATEAFYYHPIWILVLAFTVLGPFALGLVWRSRVMSPATKGVLAAIILVYTAVTFYSVYVLGDILYREFSLLNQIM